MKNKGFFRILPVLAAGIGLFCSVQAQEQEKGLIGQGITLSVVIPEQQDPFPSGAESYLTNKLIQVAVNNGVAAEREYSRFFIAANIAMATKDILPGPPQQISQNMEVTLYIADYVDKKIFSSTTVNTVGVGVNDTKCFINALKNIPVNSPQLNKFVTKGKQKIIDYYRQNADRIIKHAELLAAQHQYEEAFYMLTSIPDEVGEAFDKAIASTLKIYQAYVDRLCDENLAKARAAWAAKQNSEGAADAGVYLSQIYPDAKCHGDAMELYREIKGKVLDDWKFEMKKWQDGVDLESQRINAMRDVGVAYGRGQQPNTYAGWGWLR